jgi:hypothetical protein
LGEAYVKMEMPYLRHMIAGLMRWLDVDKLVEVEGVSEGASQDLEIMVLDARVDADRTVVVINHGDEDVNATFRIQVRHTGRVRQPGRVQVRELIHFRSLEGAVVGDRIVLNAAVPGRDVAVFNIYRLLSG